MALLLENNNTGGMDSATCSNPDICAGDSSSSSFSTLDNFAIYGTTAVVAMGLSTILLMQLDGVSRLFLSPKRLLAKRRREYKYALEQGSEYTSLMIRQHVGGGKGEKDITKEFFIVIYSTRTYIALLTNLLLRAGVYDPKTESFVWEKIGRSDSEEISLLISDMLDSMKATPVIVAIEQDLEDQTNPNEYHLFLAFPPDSSTGDVSTPAAAKLYRRVRVPLIIFCDRLAKAFKEQMTSTALCFVSDASSGLGTDMLTDVVKDCNHGVVSFLHLHILIAKIGMLLLNLTFCIFVRQQ